MLHETCRAFTEEIVLSLGEHNRYRDFIRIVMRIALPTATGELFQLRFHEMILDVYGL